MGRLQNLETARLVLDIRSLTFYNETAPFFCRKRRGIHQTRTGEKPFCQDFDLCLFPQNVPSSSVGGSRVFRHGYAYLTRKKGY